MTGVQTSALPIYQFESLCRGFKSLLQSLFMFFMRDSNHWIGDSNRWLSTSLLSSYGIRIAWLRIRIGQPQFPYWNLDSNLFMRDSNRLCQSDLFGMWIRIAIWGIRITFFSLNFLECGFESLCEGFESPSSVCTFWNVDSNRYVRDSNHLRQFALFGMWIRIVIWGIRIAFFEFAWKAPELKGSLKDSNRLVRDLNLTTRK